MSGRDISEQEINRRRDEIIEWYKSKGLYDQALELKMIGDNWKKIHDEY
jgi:hypothetical protein